VRQEQASLSDSELRLSTQSLTGRRTEHIDTRVTVETPEGVDFRFVIAGPGKRSVAFLADLVLKIAITIGIALLLSTFSVFGSVGGGLAAGLFFLTLFIVNWFYSGLFEAYWGGRTPGKKMCSLRVVRTNGTPVSPLNALGRNLLSAADCLAPIVVIPTWCVGLLTMFSNRRMQRVGDVFFDTMVVDESRDWVSRAAGITTGVEIIPRAECSDRYSIPERTLAVIERLFEGDRFISDGRREEIAKPVSIALRRRLGWEEQGPDPSNPHLYFTKLPHRHTAFLRRVLKTFSDDPLIKEENSRTQASATHRRIRAQSVTGVAPDTQPRVADFRGAEGTLDFLNVEWSGSADDSVTVDSHPEHFNDGSRPA
jgi:uncharacterized RDD family membrane protein YckC